MPILWKKKKTEYKPATGGTPRSFNLEVFQGDSIDLLDYISFENDTDKSKDIWEAILVNAAYFTDNGVSSPTAIGEFKDSFLDDDEIRQYASKYALSWKAEIEGVPIIPPGLAGLLINKYGILDTSQTGVIVGMKLKIWANFSKQAEQFKLKDPTSAGPNDEIEYLTVTIKSNTFLGEGGLLNSITGSVDKYVTDAMDYVTGALSGGLGYIGEGVGWASKQVSSLLGGGKPKGFTAEEAKKQLEDEKDRETNLFATIIGYPVTFLDNLTSGTYTPIIKSGIRAVSLASKLYRAYTQGKAAWATTVLLANLKSLLDYDRLSRRQKIHIAKFLGVNPGVLERITWVVRKILDIKELVDAGDYDKLKEYILKDLDKGSIDELEPEMRSLVTGELFEDISLGAVVIKKYEVPDKNTVKISFDNPSYEDVPGNTLILTRIEIESIKQDNDKFIEIKGVTNSAALKSGNANIPDASFANAVTLKENGRICEIVYNGAIGKETGVDFAAYGIFPSGKDVLTITLDNIFYDQRFEYDGGDKTRKGYIPLKIKYHYMGNTTPLEQVTNDDGTITFVKADVILAERDTTEEEFEFDGFVKGSYAEKENQDKDGFALTKTAANAYLVYEQYKKKQFLSIFDAVDFKNLPPAVQALIVSVGGMVGVDQSEIVRYYEVLSGAKNLYELSTKGFQHWDTLPPELKTKISKQLGVSEETLSSVIPVAGDLTDMITGKRFNKPGEKEAYLQGIFDKVGNKLLSQFGPNGEVWDKYNKVIMEKDTSSGKMVRKVLPGQGSLDKKMKQTIAAALGFTDLKKMTEPYEKKQKLDKDGKVVKDAQGNPVMENVEYLEVPGLSIIKCGMVIEKAMKFRDNLQKGIELKNKLLEKYETIKNTPDMLSDESAMMGVYDTIVDTRSQIEKEGILKDIYDSAGELTADPYADLLDEIGPDKWRETFNVEDKYVVKVPISSKPDGGVTGDAIAGNYVIYTYPWVTDIIQDTNTGEIILVGNPPPDFTFNPNDVNWYIEIKK